MESTVQSENASPEAPRGKQTRKTWFIVLGFFAALGLLIAMNMK